jgi:hypothetical protein
VVTPLVGDDGCVDVPYRPSALCVRAEHIGDDGVWNDDSDHVGPVVLNDLGVSAGLTRRLKEWNGLYQETALTDFQFPSPEDQQRWVQEGLQLAYELQNRVVRHRDQLRPR